MVEGERADTLARRLIVSLAHGVTVRKVPTMARQFAIMRLEKVKTLTEVSGLDKHIERKGDTPNADASQDHLNERLVGSGDWRADVSAKLPERRRKNAVLAIQHVLSASPEFFDVEDPGEWEKRCKAWCDASMEWLHQTYTSDNVVAARLHRDESTPHLHAVVVPLDEHGHLNARHFIGGSRYRLSRLQDSYHEAVKDLGLERGVRGSVTPHQTMKRLRGELLNHAGDARRRLSTLVRIEVPSRFMDSPQEYASRQRAQVIEALTPTLTALEQRVADLSRQVERLQRKLSRQVERKRVPSVEEVPERPAPDLSTVLAALGATRDAADPRRWYVEGQPIDIVGDRWRMQGDSGVGALDLVLYVHPSYDTRDAISYLRHELGHDAAMVAVARHAEVIAEHDPVPLYEPPEPDDEQWARVRSHLVDDCALPTAWIDVFHDRGLVYADSASRVVFLHRGSQGEVTGASLQGTRREDPYAGLAIGSRQAGCFSVVLPAREQDGGKQTPVLIIADTPIEALSALEIHREQYGGGSVTALSTDRSGRIPVQRIEDTLNQGGLVRIATKHDPAGERVWQHLREQHPEQVVRAEPPESWNEALRFQRLCQRDLKQADRELHARWERDHPRNRDRGEPRTQPVGRSGSVPRESGGVVQRERPAHRPGADRELRVAQRAARQLPGRDRPGGLPVRLPTRGRDRNGAYER